jgi:ribonuclease HI
MALAGAIAVLEWIRRQWRRANVRYVSDSEYLVKGISEWVPGWQARGWKRKGGAVEQVWRSSCKAAARARVAMVRGHAGHAKGTPIRLRCGQRPGALEASSSGFDSWLAASASQPLHLDPDREVRELA